MKKFFQRVLTDNCACQSTTVSTNCSAAFKAARRVLSILLIVAGLLTNSTVNAEIQIFDGAGQYIANEIEDAEIAKMRARQRAEQDAQEKAGIYITSFSRSLNSRLNDDEISSVANTIISVSDVEIKAEPFIHKGNRAILYKAMLKAKIDTDTISDFLKRNEDEKFTVLEQNSNLKNDFAANDAHVADLKEKYAKAATQAEKDSIREQLVMVKQKCNKRV